MRHIRFSIGWLAILTLLISGYIFGGDGPHDTSGNPPSKPNANSQSISIGGVKIPYEIIEGSELFTESGIKIPELELPESARDNPRTTEETNAIRDFLSEIPTTLSSDDRLEEIYLKARKLDKTPEQPNTEEKPPTPQTPKISPQQQVPEGNPFAYSDNDKEKPELERPIKPIDNISKIEDLRKKYFSPDESIPENEESYLRLLNFLRRLEKNALPITPNSGSQFIVLSNKPLVPQGPQSPPAKKPNSNPSYKQKHDELPPQNFSQEELLENLTPPQVSDLDPFTPKETERNISSITDPNPNPSVDSYEEKRPEPGVPSDAESSSQSVTPIPISKAPMVKTSSPFAQNGTNPLPTVQDLPSFKVNSLAPSGSFKEASFLKSNYPKKKQVKPRPKRPAKPIFSSISNPVSTEYPESSFNASEADEFDTMTQARKNFVLAFLSKFFGSQKQLSPPTSRISADRTPASILPESFQSIKNFNSKQNSRLNTILTSYLIPKPTGKTFELVQSFAKKRNISEENAWLLYYAVYFLAAILTLYLATKILLTIIRRHKPCPVKDGESSRMRWEK